jgi:hypothetical protein
MAVKRLRVAKGHWRGIDAAELMPLARARSTARDSCSLK